MWVKCGVCVSSQMYTYLTSVHKSGTLVKFFLGGRGGAWDVGLTVFLDSTLEEYPNDSEKKSGRR